MRYLLVLGLLSCLFVPCAMSATSDVEVFEYRPERITVGRLYHYIKSNHDGTNPAKIWVYVATRNHLEVLKWEENSNDLVFVTADMNWDLFSTDHLTSWWMSDEGTLRFQAHLSLDTLNDVMRAWMSSGGEDTTVVEHYPAHIYNFDFISFNYIFRHLKDPEKSFEIGIVDPTWDAEKGIFQYIGKVSIEYKGDEKHNGIECRLYRLGGPGLNDEFGSLWVDKEEGYFVDLEHPYRDNPGWNNFKFELQSKDILTLPQWHAFMEEQQKVLRELGESGGKEGE